MKKCPIPAQLSKLFIPNEKTGAQAQIIEESYCCKINDVIINKTGLQPVSKPVEQVHPFPAKRVESQQI